MTKTLFALAAAAMLATGSVAYAGTNAPVTGPARPIYSEQAVNSHQGANAEVQFAANGRKVQLGGALLQGAGSNTPQLSEAEQALINQAG